MPAVSLPFIAVPAPTKSMLMARAVVGAVTINEALVSWLSAPLMPTICIVDVARGVVDAVDIVSVEVEPAVGAAGVNDAGCSQWQAADAQCDRPIAHLDRTDGDCIAGSAGLHGGCGRWCRGEGEIWGGIYHQ